MGQEQGGLGLREDCDLWGTGQGWGAGVLPERCERDSGGKSPSNSWTKARGCFVMGKTEIFSAG